MTINNNTSPASRNIDAIAAEVTLDGFYVIRTNLDEITLSASDVFLT